MKPLKPLGILAGLLLALGASTASADLVFNLDTGNSALTGTSPGPYATVTVVATSTTTATVTFTSLTNIGLIYLMGDGGTVGVNGLFSITGATASNSGTGFTNPSLFGNCGNAFGCLSVGGSGNLDGFGSFSDTLNTHDGFTDAWDSVILSLTADAGTTWLLDGSDVLTANSGGALAGAHIFITTSPADASNEAIVTGFAAGSGGELPPVECPPGTVPPNCTVPPSDVPEPDGLALLGLGLAGLAAIRRRRFPV